MFPRNFEAMFQICLFCLWSTLLRMSEGYYTQQWVVHVPGGKSVVESLAKDHDFVNLGEIFPDYYHFQHRKVAKRSIAPHAGKKVLLAADTRVKWFQQQKAKRRIKRDLKLQDSDPRWPSMWYLNRGNGLDMNVIPAWLEGITGKGAVVTILDDGLEKDHPDLIQNYDPMASYDVNNQDSDPSPRYDMIDSNRHGTRCAGEVAATSNNSVCALGVAHGAQVGGVRMLDGDVTDAVEARSLSLNPQHIDIYSASWGPDDDGKTVDGPGELATRAFMEGVQKGRNGKGSIFIWASGNGGREHDNCNCDGYTNSIYSLSISSATEQGHVPWYSEACSSTLASTYSSGAVGEKQVVTTDLHHSCTSSHTGTSASAPLAAGICALALEANPNLTWRDMQHIVVRTARPQHLITSDWQTNGVGRNVSHSFGYGLMDAYAMVQLARKWVTVPEQHKCEIIAPHVEKSIPARSVVILQLHVNECKGVQVLEHVQAKLTVFSQRRGDLNIQLISPMKTRVTLLAHRPQDISRQGFSHWPFMSVHSWGESPLGIWQLEIHNDGRLLGRATLQNWSLILYGTKQFDPTENISDVLNHNKVKLYPKKKKSNKNKQRNEKKSTKSPNMLSKGKASKSKNKNYFSTPKYFSPINLYSHSNKKKFPKPTEGGNYFYAVNNSKFRNAGQGVKEYLKFVKNITITYPVMIPAPDSIKSRDSFRKLQKQKEKSRDINSNSNDKLFTTKPSTSVTTPVAKLTAKPWDKTTADIKAWELVLYGTETPPAIDIVNTDGSLNTNEPPSVEIQSNAIDNDLPSRTWTGDSEIKKDTSEVEEGVPRINAISGCEKTNGHICIECSGGFYEFNGKCVSTCPEKYYPSTLDSKSKETAEEMNILRNVCLQCHYTCRRCSGSNDYQCIKCYPDAALMNVSAIEIYCYPLSMTNRIEDEKWYFRSFVLLCIVIVLTICVVGLLFYMNNRDRSSKRKYKFYKKNVLQNIRNMEETVKTAVYSDSE